MSYYFWLKDLLKKSLYPRLGRWVWKHFENGIFSPVVFSHDPAQIVEVVRNGITYRFAIADTGDAIQSQLFRGELYEVEELEIISRFFEPKSTFVDIGANVGNHSLYVLKELNAQKVIAFEPCLVQHTLLNVNAAINDLTDRFIIHKVALSNITGASWISGSKQNIADSRLRILPKGEISAVRPGDTLLSDIGPCFLKIDVEGHEIEVLAGIVDTIQKYRPPIFIEVSDINLTSFSKWIERFDYKIVEQFRRYNNNENYMIIPC
jgi:FkbM family methyltransferase